MSIVASRARFVRSALLLYLCSDHMVHTALNSHHVQDEANDYCCFYITSTVVEYTTTSFVARESILHNRKLVVKHRTADKIRII